jgi:3-oxoacyl-[acyl-carrier protein] reductase
MTEHRKVMFVTGGSRGIGISIVCEAIAAGYDVAFTYCSRKDAADAVVDRARQIDSNRRCRTYRLDVRDSAAVDRVGDAVMNDFDGVGVVVNNAGVTKAGLAFSTSDEDWKGVLETNLTGSFYVSRYFLGHLVAQRWGRLIFVSSIASGGMAGDAAYCASKAGLLGLSAGLAKEYGRKGVTSNALLLSLFETDMTDRELGEEKRGFYRDHCPVGRVGKPEEVAAAVLYLASEGAAFVNGQNIGITGGLDWFH